MNRVTSRHFSIAIGMVVILLAISCSKEKPVSEAPPSASPQPSAAAPTAGGPTAGATTSVTPPSQTTAPGQIALGTASGSYIAKGETVELKYAYAARGKRFGNDSIIILLTDKPILPEAVVEEIASQTMLSAGTIRGLEYAIEKDGYWVRFHPSQYQESKGGQLKEFTVENEVVRGLDENDDLSNGKYSRSVRFAAEINKNAK